MPLLGLRRYKFPTVLSSIKTQCKQIFPSFRHQHVPIHQDLTIPNSNKPIPQFPRTQTVKKKTSTRNPSIEHYINITIPETSSQKPLPPPLLGDPNKFDSRGRSRGHRDRGSHDPAISRLPRIPSSRKWQCTVLHGYEFQQQRTDGVSGEEV